MSIWPFLIAASRDIDYEVVLCPDFILKSRATRTLMKKLAPKMRAPTLDTMSQDLSDPIWGDLGVIYRVDRAHLNGKEIRDRSGRSIYRAYGLLFRDSGSKGQREEALRLFPEAQDAAEGAYAQFCAANSDFDPIESLSIARGAPRPPSPDVPPPMASNGLSPRPPAAPAHSSEDTRSSPLVGRPQPPGGVRVESQQSRSPKSLTILKLLMIAAIALLVSSITNAWMYPDTSSLKSEVEGEFAALKSLRSI